MVGEVQHEYWKSMKIIFSIVSSPEAGSFEYFNIKLFTHLENHTSNEMNCYNSIA